MDPAEGSARESTFDLQFISACCPTMLPAESNLGMRSDVEDQRHISYSDRLAVRGELGHKDIT